MPWKVFVEDDKHCVYKLNDAGEKTGSSLGCHDMADEAKQQVAALYANEEKELKTKMFGEEMGYGSYGATSLSELMAVREVQEMTEHISQMARLFPDIVSNIMYRDDIENKAAAIENLAQEFAQMVADMTTKELKEESADESGLVNRIYNKVKEKFYPAPKPASGFMIWKENGQYRWLATYSNNVIDDEREIISGQSHKEFVEMVDKGLTPLPELWLWHRPEWRWGQATSVAYDDTGFAIASGTVDKECEPVAEWAMAQKGLAVSHGMPRSFIKRDKDNSNVIVSHITKEISPLPYGNAANKLTEFEVLKEGDEMTIPEDKRKKLIESGLSEEALKALEDKNEQLSTEVKEAGLQTKEDKPEEKPKEVLTQEDLVKAIALAVNPVVEQVNTLASQLSTVVKELTTLSQTDEAKVKTLAESTPRDSLEELLRKEMPSLFSDATKVEKGDALTKGGPEETTEVKENEGGLFFQAWAKEDKLRGVAK